jgi:peptidylprolyl isomerase
MAQAKNGDKVRVHYTGTLEDGSIFDSSEAGSDECSDDSCGCGGQDGGPLEFVIGKGNLIPKFEAAVVGLEPGQKVQVRIASEDAYGPRVEEMVAVIERSEIPADINPEPGQQMEVILQDGTAMPVMVIEVTDTSVTLDANHPLAGRDLTFDITLVEIL